MSEASQLEAFARDRMRVGGCWGSGISITVYISTGLVITNTTAKGRPFGLVRNAYRLTEWSGSPLYTLSQLNHKESDHAVFQKGHCSSSLVAST